MPAYVSLYLHDLGPLVLSSEPLFILVPSHFDLSELLECLPHSAKVLTMSSISEHAAAVLESKGSPLTVVNRATPSPGPNEVLVEVKSIALNPIDYYSK